MAVFVAIHIPEKIAEQQNRIALFEKRFDALLTFNKCRTFALLLVGIKEQDEVVGNFYAAFKNSLDEPPSVPASNYHTLWKVQAATVHDLNVFSCLFDEEIGIHLKQVSDALLRLLYEVNIHNEENSWKSKRDDYCVLMRDELYEAMEGKIRLYLKLD